MNILHNLESVNGALNMMALAGKGGHLPDSVREDTNLAKQHLQEWVRYVSSLVEKQENRFTARLADDALPVPAITSEQLESGLERLVSLRNWLSLSEETLPALMEVRSLLSEAIEPMKAFKDERQPSFDLSGKNAVMLKTRLYLLESDNDQ
jgi:hypothetical protein